LTSADKSMRLLRLARTRSAGLYRSLPVRGKKRYRMRGELRVAGAKECGSHD
jgi:hypothetical protein